MKIATHIKPLTYFLDNANEVVDRLATDRDPVFLTRDGEACAVLVNADVYDNMINRIEELEEALALVQLLQAREKQADEGQLTPASEVLRRIKDRHRKIA